MRLKFNKSSFNKRMNRIGWFFIYFVVYMFITIAVAELMTLKNAFSVNYMQLKKTGDWFILATNTIGCLVAVFLIWKYIKSSNEDKLLFWLGQISTLILVNGVLFFSIQTSITRYQKLTLIDLKHIISIINDNFWIEYIILAISLMIMIFINYKKEWFKVNNWYYFITVAPYILELGLVYRYQQAWLQFTESSSFSYREVYAMLVNYQQHAHPISMLLMDGSAIPVGVFFFLGLISLIYIGGERLVWSWKQNKQSRKKEA